MSRTYKVQYINMQKFITKSTSNCTSFEQNHLGRHEYHGRITEIVLLLPFSEAELQQLVERELRVWATRAADSHDLRLEWDPAVLQSLSSAYDINYGTERIVNHLCTSY